jgi:TolB-like protein
MLKRGKDMISQRFVVLIICVFSLMAFAQNKPKIAIYVKGGNLQSNEIEMVETKFLTTFVQSKQYTIVERGDPFLTQLAMEMKKQRDGSVDDSQIRSLGKQAGVQFVCIATIVEAFNIISVSARLIDTESAEIPAIGEKEIKSLSEIGQAVNEIFKQINSEKIKTKSQIAHGDDENFSTGERWATFGLNFFFGLGSIIIMDDWVGGLFQAALLGGGLWLWEADPIIENDDDEFNFNKVLASILFSSSFLTNLLTSIDTDKPKNVSYSKYGNFNMAVLPSKHGGFNAYLTYRMGF